MHHTRNGRQPDEETALLASPERKVLKTPTPLPRLQIFILLLMQLAEPITSNCIYPFINQVRVAVISATKCALIGWRSLTIARQ